MTRAHKIIIAVGLGLAVVFLALSIGVLAKGGLGDALGLSFEESRRLGIKGLIAAVALMFAISIWALRLMLKDSLKQ